MIGIVEGLFEVIAIVGVLDDALLLVERLVECAGVVAVVILQIVQVHHRSSGITMCLFEHGRVALDRTGIWGSVGAQRWNTQSKQGKHSDGEQADVIQYAFHGGCSFAIDDGRLTIALCRWIHECVSFYLPEMCPTCSYRERLFDVVSAGTFAAAARIASASSV